MERIIMHIDVNNAFLSWTAVDLLNKGYGYDIRNSYAVIGGDESKRHGIVLAKSIPAKKIGIVTAETLVSARKKCRALRVFPANHNLYQEMSKKMFELLSNYSPDLECISVDECFLDYTKVKSLYGDQLLFANKIRNEIKEKLGFTVNIGIANNKLCAKMASDFTKPDKIHTLYINEIKEKMWVLDINDLYGVGKKSTEKLRQLNINTIGDLANANKEKLYSYFKNQSTKLIESANGIDNSEVINTYDDPSSISSTTTLEKDISNKENVYKVLNEISDKITLALRKQKKYATVVAVIIKDQNFKSYTHQKTLINATNITNEIYETSKQLFNDMWNLIPIRLIGIRLEKLTDKISHQVSLFENFEERKQDETLEHTVDKLKEKFGMKVINKASLIDRRGIK